MTEPTNPLTPPEYEVGNTVSYRGDPENLWKILGLKVGTQCWWAYASQNGTKQNFPAGVFTRHDAAKKSKASAPNVPKTEPKPKKKKDVGDPVSQLLAEAEDIQGCWRIAEMAGLDMTELQTKISHLSNGLQRMGIGNRLRAKAKAGEFDAHSIVWTPEGFMFESDCPEFNDQGDAE